MYEKYTKVNGSIYIRDNQGNLTKRKNKNNIREILIKENRLELLKYNPLLEKISPKLSSICKLIVIVTCLFSMIASTMGIPILGGIFLLVGVIDFIMGNIYKKKEYETSNKIINYHRNTHYIIKKEFERESKELSQEKSKSIDHNQEQRDKVKK